MATQTCWRCISKLLHTSTRPTFLPTTPGAAAAFSTTAVLSKNPHSPQGKKGVGPGAPQRGKRTLRLGKNKREKSSKPPAAGERKAIRKRIVLSNTNALEVRELKDWTEANYADQSLRGMVVGIPGPLVDSLRAVEAFKPTQGWGFFRRPATLVRDETLDLAGQIQKISDGTQKETLRRMIVGERGSGKSVLLLQAQAMAFLKGWIVIHIPEGQDLTNAHTGYAPLPDTNPIKYVQKAYTATLLSRLAKANEPILSSLELSQTHTLPIPLQSNISLTRLAELGARDPEIAWPVFQALWAELTSSSSPQPRPPLLLSLDGLPHVSRLSEYLTPSMHFIHAHDLAVVDHFMAYMSGARSLPNGGLVLGADSNSNRPVSAALDLAARQSEAAAADGGQGLADMPLFDPERPYDRVDERVVSTLRNADVMRLEGFSRGEARTVLEYYAKSGMLREAVTDRLVSEKWTLAGGGLVGELERGSVRAGS